MEWMKLIGDSIQYIENHYREIRERARRPTGGSVSETDAKALALARVSGATGADIVEFKQDYDDGRLIYEGKIIYNDREYEFEIDAATGAVLDWESESVYD